MFFKNEDSQYGEGVEFDKYNDIYSVVAANEGKDGKIYKKWCHPIFKDEAIEKKIPMGPRIGNRFTTVNILTQMSLSIIEDTGEFGWMIKEIIRKVGSKKTAINLMENILGELKGEKIEVEPVINVKDSDIPF